MTAAVMTYDEPAVRGRSPTALAIRKLLRKRLAVVALVLIAVFYVAGVLAPFVSPYDFDQTNLDATFQGPSLEHPFGTDRLGRDLLSRSLWSMQTTLIVTVATLVTGGLVLAVGLGLLAGYRGGTWVDTLIMRTGDVFFALPGLPMLILINAALGDRVDEWAKDIEGWTGIGGIRDSGAPDYLLIFGALSLFSWVGGARVIRSQVLALRETDYVTAARALGATDARVIVRHLLPNVSNLVIVSVSSGLGAIAGSEILLTWFGVGIQPPHPSFGIMIYDASTSIRAFSEHPYLIAVPASVVGTLILAFNLLGDAVNDVFTPRAR